ncbi:hypothetical protein GGI43DRAFT_226455 [Trichoderma evansii]
MERKRMGQHEPAVIVLSSPVHGPLKLTYHPRARRRHSFRPQARMAPLCINPTAVFIHVCVCTCDDGLMLASFIGSPINSNLLAASAPFPVPSASIWINQGALIGHQRVLVPSTTGRTDFQRPVLEIKGRVGKFPGASNADHLRRVVRVSVLRAQTMGDRMRGPQTWVAQWFMMGLGSYFLNNAAELRQDCRVGLACWVHDSAVAEWGLSLFWSKTAGGKTRRFFEGPSWPSIYGTDDANARRGRGDGV